jgi:mono/diheme cytochrome c family protein
VTVRATILMAVSGAFLFGAGAARSANTQTGAVIFEGACATCHAAGSPRVIAGQKLLTKTGAITGDSPRHAISIILHGHFPPPEQSGGWMPSFAPELNDAQIADVLDWLRQSAGGAPWPDVQKRVEQIRAQNTEAQR